MYCHWFQFHNKDLWDCFLTYIWFFLTKLLLAAPSDKQVKASLWRKESTDWVQVIATKSSPQKCSPSPECYYFFILLYILSGPVSNNTWITTFIALNNVGNCYTLQICIEFKRKIRSDMAIYVYFIQRQSPKLNRSVTTNPDPFHPTSDCLKMFYLLLVAW